MVELGFGIIIITAVAQRIDFCQPAGGGDHLAIGVILIVDRNAVDSRIINKKATLASPYWVCQCSFPMYLHYTQKHSYLQEFFALFGRNSSVYICRLLYLRLGE